MTAETALAVPVPKPPHWVQRRTLREHLTRNPVMLKELRGRMRGGRAFILLTGYLAGMSGFIALLYTLYVSATSNVYSGVGHQFIGKVVFGGVVGVELLLACFITPAVTAGAVSGERERQTFDLLKTTLLPAQTLVLGKLLSALLFILLLLLAALPLQSLAFLLGGVGPDEVLIATVLLIATAFLFSAAGVFFSSLMRRTLGATVLAYSFALFATLGLPLLLLMLVPLASLFLYSTPPGPATEAVLLYAGLLLVSVNPIATAVTTEALLLTPQVHSVFYFTVPLSNGAQVPLVSPWLLFVVFSFGLGLVLILLSIQMVRAVDR